MAGYGWRWPLLSRVRDRMRLQEEEKECPTVYYRDVMPENLVSGFNFLISQIPYARTILAEARLAEIDIKYYGLSFATPLGLFASGMAVVDVLRFTSRLYPYVFVELPKLGPDYYVGMVVCLEPADVAYSGMVVDVEGGIKMEIPPEIAGVYSQIVTAKSALESAETAEDARVTRLIISSFLMGEAYRIVYNSLLDMSLVEKYGKQLLESVERDYLKTKTRENIFGMPAVRDSVTRIMEYARSIPGYSMFYTTTMEKMISDISSFLNEAIDVAFAGVKYKVKAGVNTTADFIKQESEVWRVTFVR
ncbi:MAG: hypothetical protein QW304_07595 [Thermoproteota archaeon]